MLVGKQEIQGHGFVVLFGQQFQSLGGAGGLVHCEALLGQGRFQQARAQGIVFHHQHPRFDRSEIRSLGRCFR